MEELRKKDKIKGKKTSSENSADQLCSKTEIQIEKIRRCKDNLLTRLIKVPETWEKSEWMTTLLKSEWITQK